MTVEHVPGLEISDMEAAAARIRAEKRGKLPPTGNREGMLSIEQDIGLQL